MILYIKKLEKIEETQENMQILKVAQNMKVVQCMVGGKDETAVKT